MGQGEGLGDFGDLPRAFLTPEVDGGAHRHGAHVPGLRTVPNSTWSNLFGRVISSLWLIFTMKGILWAYLRATLPSTP
jgi:hypothetical protein